ncbi:aminotransferase class I/II-fold pyridoxal phosphate-dependent enzyme [Inquilinus sp. CA228]|uniref:aminotransferase class I/II-fold pyridoxal phosphate-dependent enzyme n=1 Tax=Inquilinus sp. CA228 TaxID=3455609 RepID=UPI003F8D1726
MTSSPIDILVSVTRDGPRTLGGQIEDQIRDAVRAGRLRPGAPVPSTRDLAQQLGISRPLVVEAYAQLAAEGYLSLRQGARPRVSAFAASGTAAAIEPAAPEAPPRYDFRPAVPDLASFPRGPWLKACRDALAAMAGDDFGYGSLHGIAALRQALAEYLGRVRGVAADPERVMVTSGFTQARGLPPTLLLGYARHSESVIRAGVRALAAAVRAARSGG